MDIYTATSAYLADLMPVQQWPEMDNLLQHVVRSRPRHWQLPTLACKAVGGTPESAITAVAAVGCLHTAIVLVDNLLDGEPAGWHQQIGAPATANLAVGLVAMGLAAIDRCASSMETRLSSLSGLTQMMLSTTIGQQWDMHNPSDEVGYWRVVGMKSAPFFSAALQIGAILGGAAPETADKIGQIGTLYGEIIQIHDDLNDALAVTADSDWIQGRSSLPLLFAEVVDHPDRERFRQLRPFVTDAQALAEAQTILIRCGAISYGIEQILKRYGQATATLASISLVYRNGLEGLLAEVILPIQALFAATGITLDEVLAQDTLLNPAV